MSVKNSIKLLDDIAALVVGAVQIAKSGHYWKAAALISQLMEILPEAKAALPELQDLDTAEAVELGKAAYVAIGKIVAAA